MKILKLTKKEQQLRKETFQRSTKTKFETLKSDVENHLDACEKTYYTFILNINYTMNTKRVTKVII